MSKLEEETNHQALRNVSKKYLKEKIIRQNIQFSGLKRHLNPESKLSNIKISALTKSEIQLNTEKKKIDSYIFQSPKRFKSNTSKIEFIEKR